MRSRIKRAALTILPAVLFASVSGTPAFAQSPAATGIVEQPCPAPLPVPAALVAARFTAFDPKAKPPGAEVYESPEVRQWMIASAERAKTDWANLCRYRFENHALDGRNPPQIVFVGDSITEAWIDADPAFFGKEFADRGISGQTSQQILARFYQDVVALHPNAVHILAGTNDVAGNLGPSRPQDVVNNITAMIDIAEANHIAVVLGSIPPAADFIWRPGMMPAAKIEALNATLRKIADDRGIPFADYHAAMAGKDGGMASGISSDGVHPNRAGYAIMEPIARAALRTALGKRRK